jgi:hypothetical protein
VGAKGLGSFGRVNDPFAAQALEICYDLYMTEEQLPNEIYIRDVAQMLNRKMGTLRKWETSGLLPDELLPQRGERNWRYWTPKQVDGLRSWMNRRQFGHGLPHYSPSEKELDRAIEMMRAPKGLCAICEMRVRAGSKFRRLTTGKVVHYKCLEEELTALAKEVED